MIIAQLQVQLSYNTVGIMKVRGFWPQIIPQNQLYIYFMTVLEHWLSIAKPINVTGFMETVPNRRLEAMR